MLSKRSGPHGLSGGVVPGRVHRMHPMFHRSLLSIAMVVSSVLLWGTNPRAFAQKQTSNAQSKSEAGIVARGKYIVEGVAMCGQCHTPRDNNGGSDRSRWLQGAPLPWSPDKPDSDWPTKAPRIGSTPLPASDDDMVKLLTTGIWKNGSRLRQPMPQFRMSRSDAEAVVAYLKSFNSQP